MAVATARVCYSMSNAQEAELIEEEKETIQLKSGKRILMNDNSSSKRFKQQDEIMTDATTQKKANFSAVNSNPNGMNKNGAGLLGSKPGSAKKLVIKNFKGKQIISNILFSAAILFFKFVSKRFYCKRFSG